MIVDSFVPSTSREWDNFDRSTLELESSSKLKSELLRQIPSLYRPKSSYYSHGPRKIDILTQLQCSASFLNADFSKVNSILSLQCSCEALSEDVYHFFMICPNYSMN